MASRISCKLRRLRGCAFPLIPSLVSGVTIWIGWLWLASVAVADEQLLAFARQALIEGREREIIKAKFAINASAVTREDWYERGDFLSAVWIAVDRLGLCPRGLEPDEGGARLFPLVLFNEMLRFAGRPAKVDRRPYGLETFVSGKQRFHIHWQTLLTSEQIDSFVPHRGACAIPGDRQFFNFAAEASAGSSRRQDLRQRLRHLLAKALQEIVAEKVANLSQLHARLLLFDLELAANADKDIPTDDKARQQELVQQLALQSVDSWIAMNPTWLRAVLPVVSRSMAPEQFETVVLGIIDEKIAQGRGDEVAYYIALYSGEQSAMELRKKIYAGDRGKNLLSLGQDSKFSERSYIAWHRAVDALNARDVQLSIENFGMALQWADESKDPMTIYDGVTSWLQLLFGQYTVDKRLIYLVKQTLPQSAFSAVAESLGWRAAILGDLASVNLVLEELPRRRQALESKWLKHIATRQWAALLQVLQTGDRQEGHTASRALEKYLDQLEQVDLHERSPHYAFLKQVQRRLDRPDKHVTRRYMQLLAKVDALLRASGQQGGERQAMRQLAAPDAIPLGEIKLPPNYTIPWPFRTPVAPQLNPFVPIQIDPYTPEKASSAAPLWTIRE